MEIKVILVVLSIILGIYEVLVRVFPSIGNNSIIHFIIEALRWLSNFLNNEKKTESGKSLSQELKIAEKNAKYYIKREFEADKKFYD